MCLSWVRPYPPQLLQKGGRIQNQGGGKARAKVKARPHTPVGPSQIRKMPEGPPPTAKPVGDPTHHPSEPKPILGEKIGDRGFVKVNIYEPKKKHKTGSDSNLRRRCEERKKPDGSPPPNAPRVFLLCYAMPKRRWSVTTTISCKLIK